MYMFKLFLAVLCLFSGTNTIHAASTVDLPTTAGDGYIWRRGDYQPDQYNYTHNHTFGGSADWNADGTYDSNTTIQSATVRGGQALLWMIYRGFVPVDTTALPAGANITSATLYIYLTQVVDQFHNSSNGEDDLDFFVMVGPTTQTSFQSLTAEDYDQAGPTHGATEVSNRIQVEDFTVGTWAQFELNAAGIDMLEQGGIAGFAIRSGFDVLDIPPPSPNARSHKIEFNASEAASNQPYMTVTFDDPASPIPAPLAVFSGLGLLICSARRKSS